ncbi:uncharacterized protein LOC124459848 [Drosophila willistoni]|nr:uncharacterized protein LOC124459848 [Drosophila willistoni]
MVVTTELTTRIRKAQLEDNFIKAVLEILKQRPYQDFSLKGGLLYKVVRGNDLLAVPKLMERDFIQGSHESTGYEEVIKKITDWSVVFGFPRRIISDRGVAFTSNAFAECLNENKVEHVWTSTGVARGNGQVERVNRSILSIIAKLSAHDSAKWYRKPQVQKAINSHVHASLKSSPIEVMFGTKMHNNADGRLLKVLNEELISQLNIEREELRRRAKENIENAQQAYKKNFDKRRRPEHGYRVGDMVAVKRTQFVAGRKLASEYLGPYEVTEVKRNGR